MASVLRPGRFNHVNNQVYFCRLIVYGVGGLLNAFLGHWGFCQESEPSHVPVVVSRKYIATEAQNPKSQWKSGVGSAGIGLSPKLPRVPTVVEMTGKMRNAASVLQSSGPRTDNLQVEMNQNGELEAQREWETQMATWASPNFFTHPLYFEQVNLERYQTKLHPCAIPLVSYAHFLGSIPTVPLQSGYKHPTDRSYSLGHWRPGDPVANRLHWTPVTKRGLIYQGAAAAGGVFILP